MEEEETPNKKKSVVVPAPPRSAPSSHHRATSATTPLAQMRPSQCQGPPLHRPLSHSLTARASLHGQSSSDTTQPNRLSSARIAVRLLRESSASVRSLESGRGASSGGPVGGSETVNGSSGGAQQLELSSPRLLHTVRRAIASAPRDRISSWPSVASPAAVLSKDPLGGSVGSDVPSLPSSPAATTVQRKATAGPRHRELRADTQELHNIARLQQQHRGGDAAPPATLAKSLTAVASNRGRTVDWEHITLTQCGVIVKKLGQLLHAALRPSTERHEGGGPSTAAAIDTAAASRSTNAATTPHEEMSKFLTTFVARVEEAKTAHLRQFQEITLPNKIATEVEPAWSEAVRQLETVDAAAEARAAAMQELGVDHETAWFAQKAQLQHECETLLEEFRVEESVAENVERRYQTLFDRHQDEKDTHKDAKSRNDLQERLRRNERLLLIECSQLEAQLISVADRKTQTIQKEEEAVKAQFEQIEQTKRDIRAFVADKGWLADREVSVLLRTEEEKRRHADLLHEIEELKRKSQDDAEVSIGPNMTPRPQWLERLDVIQNCRLPAPHLPLIDGTDQGDQEEDRGGPHQHSNNKGGGGPAGRGGGSLMVRQASRRSNAIDEDDVRAVGSRQQLPQLRLVTNNKQNGPSSRLMNRSKSIVKKDDTTSSSSSPNGGRAVTLKAMELLLSKGKTSKSYADFVATLRERLAMQSELQQLGQEVALSFKRQHTAALDQIVNICVLTPAVVPQILPKSAAVLVPPLLGNQGVMLPIPQWSAEEVTSRSLALWAAVLDLVRRKGELVLRSLDQVSTEELLQLCRGRRRPDSAGGKSSPSSQNNNKGGSATSGARGGMAAGGGGGGGGKKHESVEGGNEAQKGSEVNVSSFPLLHAKSRELELQQLLYVWDRSYNLHLTQQCGSDTPFVRDRLGGPPPPPPPASRAASFALPRGSLGSSTTESPNFLPHPSNDFLRSLRSTGVDPETHQPINRAAVLGMSSIFAWTSPIALLDDIGTFFLQLEDRLVSMRAALNAPLVATFVPDEAQVLVPVSFFQQALHAVAREFWFGSIAQSELFAAASRCAAGEALHMHLGGTLRSTEIVKTSCNIAAPQRAVSSCCRLAAPISSQDSSWMEALLTGGGGGDGGPPRHWPSGSVPPYVAVCRLRDCFAPLLDGVMKHAQLQQHQLRMLIGRLLIDLSMPSDLCPGAFVVSLALLEERLPQLTGTVDDPLFPSFAAFMNHTVAQRNAAMVAQGGGRSGSSGGGGTARRRNTHHQSGVGAQDAAQQAALKPPSFRFRATLMEHVLKYCDSTTGSDHFSLEDLSSSSSSGGGMSAAVGRNSNRNTSAQGWATGITRVTSIETSPSLGEEDGQQAGLRHPRTPLGLFLESAMAAPSDRQGEAAGPGGGGGGVGAYVYRPTRPNELLQLLSGVSVDELSSADFVDVDQVYQLLCRIPLRQFIETFVPPSS